MLAQYSVLKVFTKIKKFSLQHKYGCKKCATVLKFYRLD